MSNLALKLIENAKKNNSKILDLGRCSLTEIPKEVFELTQLEELYLCNRYWDYEQQEWIDSSNKGLPNKIKLIPESIRALKKLSTLFAAGDYWENCTILELSNLRLLENLQTLYLRSCNIVDISFLHSLTGLSTLNLSSNKITDISFLQPLTGLTKLYLGDNQIKDISFSQPLTGLTTLDLRSNKITDISFLQPLTGLSMLDLSYNNIADISCLHSLTGLSTLNLSYNKIGGLAPLLALVRKGLVVWWGGLDVGDYDMISIRGNPLSEPPVEIIQQGNEAILRYFEELEKSGETSVKEAKLLLTGSGEVGKTSLRYRLKDKKHALPKGDERTKQVEIDSYEFVMDQEGSQFNAHVWDFGGQQIIHHFHRFFMNESALYLLLTETSRENDDFDYWLQTIQLYGKDSPILFVQNKRNGMPRSLDIRPYKQHFNIKDELFNVNLLNNEGLDSLEKAIQYYLQQLPHTQRTIPKSWLRIRTKLEALKAEPGNHFITYQKFIEVCREEGEIDSRKGIEDVGRFLHQLGAVLWYHDNPTLKQKVILERHWATEGIFKLVFDESIQNACGRFTLEQAHDIWDVFPEYSYYANDLIAMMREFSICYPQRNDPNQYIIPALLPATQPEVAWQYYNRMVVEYHYQTILPRGLVNYLTAEMYDYIADDNHAWSAGVWLRTEDTQAKIEENRFRRKIRIELSGKQMRELFGVIKKEIDDIHRDYAGVEVELMIPCICTKCSKAVQEKIEYYKYSDVLRRFNHPSQPAINCDVSFENVSVRELLNNVLPELKPTAEAVKEEGTKIFVSYSHKDLDFRKELENRLKPLLRRKKITELWYDHQIMGGQDWDEEIRHNLNTAEIIILLISDDFWASDYIDSDELPIILERYHNNDCTVIPIVVRKDSYWKGHEISKIQAIPTDAATGKLTPISKWKDLDDAWSVIVQDIQKKL